MRRLDPNFVAMFNAQHDRPSDLPSFRVDYSPVAGTPALPRCGPEMLGNDPPSFAAMLVLDEFPALPLPTSRVICKAHAGAQLVTVP